MTFDDTNYAQEELTTLPPAPTAVKKHPFFDTPLKHPYDDPVLKAFLEAEPKTVFYSNTAELKTMHLGDVSTLSIDYGKGHEFRAYRHDPRAKTIEMPANILAAWLEALRSGRYQQAQGALKKGDGYCCLGVLVHVVDPDQLRYNEKVPSMTWLERYGIRFKGMKRQNDHSPALADMTRGGQVECATVWNDQAGRSFKEIADMIEHAAVRTAPLPWPRARERIPQYVQHFNPEGWRK